MSRELFQVQPRQIRISGVDILRPHSRICLNIALGLAMFGEPASLVHRRRSGTQIYYLGSVQSLVFDLPIAASFGLFLRQASVKM